MKRLVLLCIGVLIICCSNPEEEIKIDPSKHVGLSKLDSNYIFETLYSEGEVQHAKMQSELVNEAYQFLSEIMGPKEEFCLLVVSMEDWNRNAYSPISGMPEYYRGNLIVGAGQNEMASGFEEMIQSFPEEMTLDLIQTYSDKDGKFSLSLFFDKLSIHELTHCFQDPKNGEGYSISRWLEELHANIGLYAFYKSIKPDELKYVMSFVDFNLDNPPPEVKYSSLSEFDKYYFELDAGNYGDYQMKFTKAAQILVDSLGNGILKPLNDFIIKYDESWKDKLSEEEFKTKLGTEVDPYLLEVTEQVMNQNAVDSTKY